MQENNDIGAKWWTLTRRAFGVPDIIPDEVARDKVLDDLGFDRGHDPNPLSAMHFKNQIINEHLTKLLAAGPAGQLDRVLAGVDPLEQTITRLAPGSQEDDPRRAMTLTFLTNLKTFVEEHPFYTL